jgi:hypothetical protein
MEYIIASAVRDTDGNVFVGKRHGDAGRNGMAIKHAEHWRHHEDGFVTSQLRFLNREDALILAKENGQFKRYELQHNLDRDGSFNGYDGPQLFSEDLW